MNLRPRVSLSLPLLFVVWIAACEVHSSMAAESSTPEVAFNQVVRPILSNHCFQCHGPDEADRRAGLRLDVPGDLDLESLVDRITSDDPDMVMPPPHTHKPLSAAKIDALRAWVQQGAPYAAHWSFRTPVTTPPPTEVPESHAGSEIDRFVYARLRSRGLQPSPPADRRTLIRRLALDLTGLPPTREEIQQYLNDRQPGAYERLVDRYLDSHHFGEHLGRFWLDLVRFADTNGLHHDHYREMTPYRDWVIRSFNENLPMDEFITAQIAGDLYESPTTDQLIASGFNRLHLIIDRGTALPEESFARNVIDRVSSVGTVFLGLTLECAVCHDHKFDPITQRDFYQLYAFFNNFDGQPETGSRGTLDFRRGLQPPYLQLPSQDQQRRIEELDAQIANLQARLDQVTPGRKKPEDDADAASVGQSAEQQRDALAEKLKHVRSSREELLMEVPATLVMRERSEIRPAHILIRGNYDQPGEQVSRDTPGFLPPLGGDASTPDRMDLAQWIVSGDNPLTARVAVNRFWQYLFGVGLVKTSEDFGAQGEPPSHPLLLDQLAVRFIESGWDVKAMFRSIVTSQTYRQSARADQQRYRADPENRLLSRGSRYRLDAEVIRDQVLAASGLLNRKLYGKSVKPPQPPGLWEIVAMPYSYPRVFEPDSGAARYRRSVYTFWKRGLPPPQMTIFDAPTRESCTARRERTNTPLQALVLMNEPQYFAAALHMADGLIAEHPGDGARIDVAYETITSQLADDWTRQKLLTALDQFRRVYTADPDAATALVDSASASIPQYRPACEVATELSAWTMLVHSLLNLDRTKTRE